MSPRTGVKSCPLSPIEIEILSVDIVAHARAQAYPKANHPPEPPEPSEVLTWYSELSDPTARDTRGSKAAELAVLALRLQAVAFDSLGRLD